MTKDNERYLCEQRLLALLPELNDYDSLTLHRGLSGVIDLPDFVEINFLNARHAELFSRVWGEWQWTWNYPVVNEATYLEEKNTAKSKLIRTLDGAAINQNLVRQAGTPGRVQTFADAIAANHRN